MPGLAASAVCGLFGAGAALASPPGGAAAAADATFTAVTGIAGLNAIIDTWAVAQADRSGNSQETPGNRVATESAEQNEQSNTGDAPGIDLESALDNEAASTASEAADARQDATEAVQEQSQNVPQD